MIVQQQVIQPSVARSARDRLTQAAIGWTLLMTVLSSAAIYLNGLRVRTADGNYSVVPGGMAAPVEGLTALVMGGAILASFWSIHRIGRQRAYLAGSLILLFAALSHFEFDVIPLRDLFGFLLGLLCILVGASPSWRFARGIAWVYLFANVVGIIMFPTQVFVVYDVVSVTNHFMQLFQFPLRLFGIEPHANTLAFVAGCLLIVVLMSRPKVRAWSFPVFAHWALVVGLVGIIVLSQSKTVVSVLILTLIICKFRWRPGFWFPVAVLGLSMGYIFAVDFLATSTSGVDLTLTGRTIFWNELRQAVVESPLVGYGELGVSNALESSTKGEYAAASDNAHNMGWQVAIQGGAIGLFTLVLTMSNLWKVGRRNQLAIALLVFGVLRGMTEGHTPVVNAWVWILAFMYFEPPDNPALSAPVKRRRRRSLAGRRPVPLVPGATPLRPAPLAARTWEAGEQSS